MESIPLLTDIVAIMAVSVVMSIVLTRAGLPTVIGYLIAGVVIGPSGFGLVTELGTVDTLSQIGVVLLLFAIGLEFSVARMLKIRRQALVGGGLQVLITAAVVFAAAYFMKAPLTVALLLGFVVSLSSTAIVMKLLVDNGAVNSVHGSLTVGILLFQDVAVVLMAMALKIAGGWGGGEAADLSALMREFAFSFAAFGVIVAAVVYLIPKFFDKVASVRNREVFVLSIFLVCLGTAWASSFFGLSLALGAFIAGLAVSESDYSHQITADILPFRDTFSSLFFVSIGMLLDFKFFVDNALWIALIAVAIVAVKAAATALVGRVLRFPTMMSMAVGLNLAQIGEFSFILIKSGSDYGILGPEGYQSLLAASILTMAATPFIYRWSSAAAFSATRYLGTGAKDVKKPGMSNHVIIAGYGLNGRNLATVLRETGIQHLVADVNMQRVREARAAGHKGYYADASHGEILLKLGVEAAKMLVVAITDPVSARRMVKTARDLNPALTIVVRTRYIREMEELHKLGANQVIPEEFETSVEIFARVLRDYRVPGNIIQNQIDLVRQEGYAMLRTPALTGERMAKLTAVLEASLMDTFYVDEGCGLAGKTLADLDMRRKTGASVIAVVRKGAARTNPHADFEMSVGDILVILGSHAELNAAFAALKAFCPAAAGEAAERQ